jgi:hypothetical protein
MCGVWCMICEKNRDLPSSRFVGTHSFDLLTFTSNSKGMTSQEPRAVVKRFIDCVTDRIAVGAWSVKMCEGEGRFMCGSNCNCDQSVKEGKATMEAIAG